MIENFYLNDWRQQVPWFHSLQVEQDLLISRALVALYQRPLIKEKLAFRGGTALNKLYFSPPERYSEDIDLVQLKPESIGEILDEIRLALDPWLGIPKRKLTERGVKLLYRFQSQDNIKGKLKIEINTTEHFHIYDLVSHKFSIDSRWFTGESNITTYTMDELMGTKLRALYQRRKGRDLFDLWVVLNKNLIKPDNVLYVFSQHGQHTKQPTSRAMFEKNLCEKAAHPDFQHDVNDLLSDSSSWSFEKALVTVSEQLIKLLPGEAWKKSCDNPNLVPFGL